MIIKTKENIKNCQIDISDWILRAIIENKVVFAIKLTEKQECEIFKSTKNNNNFDNILELIDIPF